MITLTSIHPSPTTDLPPSSSSSRSLATSSSGADTSTTTTSSTMAVVAKNAINPLAPENWGRKTKATYERTFGCLCIILGCPLLIIMYWVALEQYNGSMVDTFRAALDEGPVQFLLQNLPQPKLEVFVGYAVWLLFQAMLFLYLPGPIAYGQRTPGGNILSYTANGLTAWALTHLLFLTASVLGFLDPAIIARNWEPLIVVINTYGFSVAIFSQIKGYLFPSHPEDVKVSGSLVFDLWAGVEHNPRFGKHFDFKFFHNGRVGMLVWTLIDLSWAAYQYQTFGEVTNSMLILLVLHTMYNVDFFCNEDWYLRTIDISHEHFGFMLAWGCTTFLPTFYTLQAQYLARYPTQLSTFQSCGILSLGVLGYAMFRSANHQRDLVRSQKDRAQIWGRKATYIECTYRTSDGKEHESLLLTSGWWGVARHSNYVADLIGSWAYCATCGFDNILPWSYFIFICILLYHRIGRDERRCRTKYGEKWDEYCRAVPYRLIPGIY